MKARDAAPVHRGFGLVEALVALALLASTGMALFAWVNQSLETATRLRERERELQWQQLAAAWLQTVDLKQLGEGEAQPVPGLNLRWRSRAVQAPTDVPPSLGGQVSAWQVQLVELEGEFEAEGLARPTRVTVRRLRTHRLKVDPDAD